MARVAPGNDGAPGGERITNIFRAMMEKEGGLQRGTHGSLLSKQVDCFEGRSCVAWLVANDHAVSSDGAVALGRTMQDLGYIQHVTQDRHFGDNKYLYRLDAEPLGERNLGKFSDMGKHGAPRRKSLYSGSFKVPEKEGNPKPRRQSLTKVQKEMFATHGNLKLCEEERVLSPNAATQRHLLSSAGAQAEQTDDGFPRGRVERWTWSKSDDGLRWIAVPPGIVHPKSKLSNIWMCLNMVAIVICMFFIPFQLSFDIDVSATSSDDTSAFFGVVMPMVGARLRMVLPPFRGPRATRIKLTPPLPPALD